MALDATQYSTTPLKKLMLIATKNIGIIQSIMR